MRYPAFILALTGAAMLTGCSDLISLNPFVADGQTATDSALVGTWKSADSDDKDVILIQQKGPIYTIRIKGDKPESMEFEGRVARVGDAELLDVIRTDEHDLVIPVHLVARIWPEAGKLKWAYLDSAWIRNQAKQALATQPSGGSTLITTQGDPVVQFLKKFGADPRAYSGDPNVWAKVP